MPSSAGATSSQLRRQRPCAPASSEDHVSHTVVRPDAICHFFNCRYGALAHQRLGPRSPPPRSPPGWTERLPSFTSSHDSSSSRVLSSDRRGASQLSSAAWPMTQGHPLSPMGSRHSYTPPPAARLQSAASPTQPRTPCTPKTPKVLQVWLGDLSDQPWHGRSEKARSRSHASRASRASCSTRTLSSTLSGTLSSRSSVRFVASRGSREPGHARSPACPLPLSAELPHPHPPTAPSRAEPRPTLAAAQRLGGAARHAVPPPRYPAFEATPPW